MQTAIIVIGIIISAFVFLIFMSKAKMKNLPTVVDNQNILTLTTQNFQNQTKEKLVLVDFWAPWCAPCRMMAPVLNDLAGELSEKSKVGKVNVDEHQDAARQYGIASIPTLLLFKDGQLVDRAIGAMPKPHLEQFIKGALED